MLKPGTVIVSKDDETKKENTSSKSQVEKIREIVESSIDRIFSKSVRNRMKVNLSIVLGSEGLKVSPCASFIFYKDNKYVLLSLLSIMSKTSFHLETQKKRKEELTKYGPILEHIVSVNQLLKSTFPILQSVEKARAPSPPKLTMHDILSP